MLRYCSHCVRMMLPRSDGSCPGCSTIIDDTLIPIAGVVDDNTSSDYPKSAPKHESLCPSCHTFAHFGTNNRCTNCGENVFTQNSFAQGSNPLSFHDIFYGSQYDLTWLLFSCRGRIPRRVYWLTIVCWALALYTHWVAMFVITEWVVITCVSEQDLFLAITIAPFVVTLVTFPAWLWISVALDVKRLHDLDRSGNWYFFRLVPILGPIWSLIEIGGRRGTIGNNRFGPDLT